MIVCICKQVSETEVRKALCDGHASVESLRRCLGVGSGCGTCLEFARDMVEEHAEAPPLLNAAAPVPA